MVVDNLKSSLVPSSKRSGHSPFKAKMMGSTPSGITVTMAEWLNAADCGSAKEKSFVMGSNPIGHTWVSKTRKTGTSKSESLLSPCGVIGSISVFQTDGAGS